MPTSIDGWDRQVYTQEQITKFIFENQLIIKRSTETEKNSCEAGTESDFDLENASTHGSLSPTSEGCLSPETNDYQSVESHSDLTVQDTVTESCIGKYSLQERTNRILKYK